MMKITITHPKEVKFDELKTGELFISNDILYMKIQSHIYSISAKLEEILLEGIADPTDFEQSQVNAVSLGSGGAVYFSRESEVIRVREAELTVNT